MDIEWGSPAAAQFITNVGLITSDGPNGPNIMACEWTHHVSYSPALIAICIEEESATMENIRQTKEFGVNLASVGQNVLSSLSGGYTGKETDKIAALKELGFEFFQGKIIKSPMVKDVSLNAECTLVEEFPLGDHVMVIGEVKNIEVSGKEPLAFHKGRYWKMTETLQRPSDEERAKRRVIMEKYTK